MGCTQYSDIYPGFHLCLFSTLTAVGRNERRYLSLLQRGYNSLELNELLRLVSVAWWVWESLSMVAVILASHLLVLHMLNIL